MAWTDERIDALKSLWADGLSASQIAGRLGGVTRNAVIGKVMRLGLSGRPAGKRLARLANAARRQKTRPAGSSNRPYFRPEPYQPAEAPFVPPEERISFDRLEERSCRFPYGDGPFTFCAKKKLPGLPYCEGHFRVAYQGPVPRQRVPFRWKERVLA